MTTRQRNVLCSLTLALWIAGLAPSAAASEPVLFADSTALSPDGSTLIFSWRGDIWRVASSGGAAERVTAHEASDTQPEVSPNGEDIAFVSDRTGHRQIFLVDPDGGEPRQITHHTEGHSIEGWYPDGESLLISASRDHFWRHAERFYRQPTSGEQAPELLFDGYGDDGSLSPDGRKLLFTREGTRWWRKGYHGPQASQIWMFDTTTDEFTKLTSHEHGERHPLWLPSGTAFLYTSQESGTFNLWRRNLADGSATQLTSFEDDGVMFPCVSRDGSTVVFRRLADLYHLDLAAGGLPKKIGVTYDGDPWISDTIRSTLSSASHVAFADDAREIAFVAGGDLWVMDTELREPVRITDTPEEERDPVFSPDFNTILFVSDSGGQTDIWSATRADDDSYWWQQEEFRLERLTKDAHGETRLRFTPDGRVAFIKGLGDLWLMDADGDDAERLIESWNAPSFDFSPDGEWVVYTVSDNDFNNDVWLRRTDGTGEPFNLSRHPDNEGAPAWSPDGKMIAFTGRRWEDETDIYYVYLQKESDEETARDRKLEKALKKMKGRKSDDKKKDDDEKSKASADSKKDATTAKSAAEPKEPAEVERDAITGTWEGSLRGPAPLPPAGLPFSVSLDLGDENTVSGTFDAEGIGSAAVENGTFDPAEKRLTCTVTSPQGAATIEATVDGESMRGTWRLPIGLAGELTATRQPAKPAPPVAKSGTASDDKTKAEVAKKDEEEEDDDTTKTRIDFDGLEDRIQRISIANAGESGLLWSPDSKKLAFRTSVNGRRGLYTVEFPDKLSPKFVSGNTGSNARWLSEGNQIVWLQGGRPASMTAGGKSTSYDFNAIHEADRAAQYVATFDQCWRTMRDRYYDERLGNKNWDAVGRKYRALAERCKTTGELTTVVNHMLGELNGSHLGFFVRGGGGGSGPAWRESTAHLGVRFDPTHRGPGLLIADVIEDTPASREASRLEAGEIILAVDGTTVDPSLDLARVLNGRLDRDMELRVRGTDGEERTVDIRPTSYGSLRSRLYDTWVRANQEHVIEATDGKLGYLHIRGMNWPSFQKFQEELYKIGHGRDGLIIDVRENGGGFTTDHLLTCLTQPEHAITVPRGGGQGYPHDRRVYATWDKPILVLCNQNSFSNAEIFSHAVKTLGRGQVVGVKTAGGVISTGGTSIMGMGFLRLPFRGWYLLNDGEDMELNGCEPHHVVWPEPAELPAGKDRQLDKGIEVLLADVAEWKARKRPELRKAMERD